MIKKLLALLLIPVQVLLLLLMLPLLLIFGSGLLGVIIPTKMHKQARQPAADKSSKDEELKEGD
ncbi:MAG: hypothetical protein RMM17_13885 [Acidobacteriota bacterium]|nr:hypothetical protein [Blastocatellia bacterium]MDW8413758.1 hypothetical protein [Acidobacteriota bacterium]